MLRRLPSLENVTIGILTALPKEFAAVKATFSCGRDIAIAAGRGTNTLFVGKVQKSKGESHAVAVALQPFMGTEHAAATATSLIDSCPNLRYLLMVGIAAAVPASAKIGDVVVSDSVIKYDSGKLIDGQVDRRPKHHAPSCELLNTVRRLEANELLGASAWREEIADIIYERPEWKRPDDGSPQLIVGAIGSGNMVIKDGQWRDKVSKELKLCAIEMEGCGMAAAAWTRNVDWLVIRGTCDNADCNKNDEWQKYAALIAACFAKSLLQELPADPLRFSLLQKLKRFFMRLLGIHATKKVPRTPQSTVQRIDLQKPNIPSSPPPINAFPSGGPRITFLNALEEPLRDLIVDIEDALNNSDFDKALEYAKVLEPCLTANVVICPELWVSGCTAMARVEIYRMHERAARGLKPDPTAVKMWARRGRYAAE